MLKNRVEVVDALKGKAIQEYDKLIHGLRKGKKPDYKFLMTLINFISLPHNIDKHTFIKQQLLNHDDTVYLRFDL